MSRAGWSARGDSGERGHRVGRQRCDLSCGWCWGRCSGWSVGRNWFVRDNRTRSSGQTTGPTPGFHWHRRDDCDWGGEQAWCASESENPVPPLPSSVSAQSQSITVSYVLAPAHRGRAVAQETFYLVHATTQSVDRRESDLVRRAIALASQRLSRCGNL